MVIEHLLQTFGYFSLSDIVWLFEKLKITNFAKAWMKKCFNTHATTDNLFILYESENTYILSLDWREILGISTLRPQFLFNYLNEILFQYLHYVKFRDGKGVMKLPLSF